VNHLNQLACAAGEVAKFDGTNWVCTEDIDTDTSAATECEEDEVLLGDGSCANINQSQAPSPLFIADGLGNRIGPAVSWNALALFLTTTGYFSRVSVGDQQGRPERDGDVFTDHLFYEFPDCAGQPYAIQLTLFATGQGVVFAAYTASGSKTLVSAKEATLTTITRQSLTSENGCVNSQEQDSAYPVVPNDPNITGLSVTSFPTPITLQE
jgi:hypothetical protein